jgi:hypothetical protein
MDDSAAIVTSQPKRSSRLPSPPRPTAQQGIPQGFPITFPVTRDKTNRRCLKIPRPRPSTGPSHRGHAHLSLLIMTCDDLIMTQLWQRRSCDSSRLLCPCFAFVDSHSHSVDSYAYRLICSPLIMPIVRDSYGLTLTIVSIHFFIFLIATHIVRNV